MDGEPEAYKDDSLRGISISPRERLERIENLLGVINGKLDQKADKTDLGALEVRVRGLELQLQRVQQRLAYYAGALALAGIALEIGTRFWTR